MSNILIGKTIEAVYLADDQQAIKFTVKDPTSDVLVDIVANADGDCCSHTWIENVENPEAIIGSPVLEAGSVDIGRADEGEHGYDVIAFYGFNISTVKGTCKIDYRNSSNGYYGGNLSWPDDYYYGGVFGQNNTKGVWRKLA
jgi:hypothetical protein